MKAHQQSCYDYYGTLCGDIDRFILLNDKYELWQVEHGELFNRLTDEQKSDILKSLKKPI